MIYANFVEAQVQVLHRPLLMGLYAQTPTLYNPAQASQYSRYESWTSLQRWPLLSYFTAHFNARLSKSRTHRSASVLGLGFSNEREGSFLNRSTGYVLFCRHQRLNEKLYLSAGINLGLFSYLIGQTQNRAGYSDNTWDGSLGLSLWGEDFSIGLSMLYAFDAELRPAGSVEIVKLARHYNFSFNKTLAVNTDFTLESAALIRYGALWGRFGYNTDIAVSIFARLQQKVRVGFAYQHGSGITFGAGLHEVRFGDVMPPVSLTVGYTQPFDRTQLSSINRYELVLKIAPKLSGKLNQPQD